MRNRGIETSFRELKYALSLNTLHAKKVEFILQEIYMRLIVYNFSMKIVLQVKPKTKKRVWGYQLNFTRAFAICRAFIRNKNINVEQLLIKYILPIRPDRQDQRKLKVKTFTSFLYRVA